MSQLASFYRTLVATPVLSHTLLALVIQSLAALPLSRLRVPGAWWIGAALSIGFWWGRKKLEFEQSLIPLGQPHAALWYRGWLPLEWPADYRWQFLAPAAANILLACLMALLARRHRPPPA
jgi:hypothetical protein